MNIETVRNCSNLAVFGIDEDGVSEQSWEAMLSAGMFIGGDFEFAAGTQATLKADSEVLLSHPRQLKVIVGYFATYPCILDAEVLLYVADGMRDFTNMVGEEVNKPVVQTYKPKGSRYESRYMSKKDKDLAMSATKLTICEDVVSTLGSVAGTRRLLGPGQDVHCLAMLLRGVVNPAYRERLIDHYLVKRKIPTDKRDFARKIVTEWSTLRQNRY